MLHTTARSADPSPTAHIEALAALQLFSPDRSVRAQSIAELKDKAKA